MKVKKSFLRFALCGCLVGALGACSSDPAPNAAASKPAGTATDDSTTAAKEIASKTVPETPREPRRDTLSGGPYPTLLVAQAQFIDGEDGPRPGPAKLTIVRQTPQGWQTSVLEDPHSNVFHKAMMFDGTLLTIGANEARLKTWKQQDGAWVQQTHWNPKFGGRFDRLRDIEAADVDGDDKSELVIATHDQGEIVIVHPDEDWRVEKIDAQPNTFVHEIEIGDVDGDGNLEIFATPSKPNKLDQEQPGEVTMYRRDQNGAWQRSIVDAPGDTHAKEILAANPDGEGASEVFIVWEGAIDEGKLARPVTIKEYRFGDGAWADTVVDTVPDRQMRAITSGDVTGDGKVDLVAGGLSSGLWLFEQGESGWTKTLIDGDSSGYEHPLTIADLDGDGLLEIYVASEDQGELRRYRWADGQFEKTVVTKLAPGEITWNVQAGKL